MITNTKLTQTERLRVNRILKESGKKSCSCCNKILSLDNFFQRGDKKGRARSYCNHCASVNVQFERRDKILYDILHENGQTLAQKPKILSGSAIKSAREA